MQYIVMDLEWNQPTSYQSAAFRKVGDSLLFEIIQIGAVKLNENFEIIDTINLPVCPTHYMTIHPRVRRMTRLTQEELCDAPQFNEAMEQFVEWCGEEYVVITWGCDDISVLQQNIDFFRFKRPMPKMYDAQRRYAEAFQLGSSQKALKGAMEQLLIEPEEDRDFHNAMHDAYYTALVLKKMPEPQKVLNHEEQPRKLSYHARRSRFRITQMIPSVREALNSPAIRTPQCSACKQPTQLQTQVIPQAPGKYVALSKCLQHGLLFVKVSFSLLPDGQKGMHLSVLPANRQNKAYVHTKQLQYEYKCKHGGRDAMDVEDIGRSFSSNMPFEDA